LRGSSNSFHAGRGSNHQVRNDGCSRHERDLHRNHDLCGKPAHQGHRSATLATRSRWSLPVFRRASTRKLCRFHPDLAAVAADPQIAKLNTGASSTVKSSPSDMSLRNCMNHLYTRLRLRRVIEITSAEFRIQNATGPPP